MLSETNFNQDQLKFCYTLKQTLISSLWWLSLGSEVWSYLLLKPQGVLESFNHLYSNESIGYVWNISAHSDHEYLFWASRKMSFQCLHLHRAAINTRHKKMSETSLLAEILIYCFDLLKKSWWFSSIFNMCLFHMHVWQENALQSHMVIVRFSPKTVSQHAVIWRYPYEHALSLWGINGKCN